LDNKIFDLYLKVYISVRTVTNNWYGGWHVNSARVSMKFHAICGSINYFDL